MKFLLGSAPWCAFLLLISAVSVPVGLWVALGFAMLNAGMGLARGERPLLLDATAVGLFAVLAVGTVTAGWRWSVPGVRLAMDSGLLAMVLASLAVDRPFTLQYARKYVPPDFWRAPLFLRVNRLLSWAWAAALLVVVGANAVQTYVPGSPAWIEGATAFAALVAAGIFTSWYPPQARRKAGLPPHVRPGIIAF